MPFAFHFAARSDVGLVRRNNEDSGYAGPRLLAMADGMGGHAGGEVASSVAIASLVALDDDAIGASEASSALLDAIHAANTGLGERIRAEKRLDGMGTTLIAMLRARDKIVLAHIGDSRAFLVRDGAVEQITKDHSYVQTLVDEGRLAPEEAASHPQRSLVTRVLTGNPDDEPDLVVRQARTGDRYLIASDGLTDYVARETIDEILLADPSDPGAVADRLVALALRAGAPDNVTIVIGDVVDYSQGEVPPANPQVVGAVSTRSQGTRPIPTTPAAKAAALTKEATGIHDGDDEAITLAEEGTRSRRGALARVVGTGLALAVVLAGGGYAASTWLRSQYYVGVDRGQVSIFSGVPQSVGPLSFSRLVTQTTIPLSDLPQEPYQTGLVSGTSVDNLEAANDLVSELSLQARACRWAKAAGEVCTKVSNTWIEPTPTPSLSPSSTPSPSATPSGRATTAASPSPSPSSTGADGP